jgi:hypothetical protein
VDDLTGTILTRSASEPERSILARHFATSRRVSITQSPILKGSHAVGPSNALGCHPSSGRVIAEIGQGRSLAWVHACDQMLDRAGNVWYADLGQMFRGKMDPKTGKGRS